MASENSDALQLLLIGLNSSLLIGCYGTSDDSKVYIVYMGGLPKSHFSASDLHSSMLQEATGSDGSDSIIYSYKRSFNGFAAKLTDHQMLKLAAFPMSPTNNPKAEFAYGAGHINPIAAIDPGLVHDACDQQYIQFLCGQGYTTKQLQLITGDNSTCSNELPKVTSFDLNLPSFTLFASSNHFVGHVFHRVVTNVGSAVSTYKAIVKAPKGLNINVIPDFLSFKYIEEKKPFLITVFVEMGNASSISGTLIWDDGKHQVRSPIVAYVSS